MARGAVGLSLARSLTAALTGFNRMSGYPGKIRPGKTGGPVVDIHGTVGTGVGRLGPCAVFDGSSMAAAPLEDYDIESTGAWTIGVDFKMSAAPSLAGDQYYLLAYDRADLGVRQLVIYLYKEGNGNVALAVSAFKSSGGGGLFTYYINLQAQVGTWYTVTFSKTSGNVYTLRCNGAETSTPNGGTAGTLYTDVNNNNTLSIGGKWDASNGYTNGFKGTLENLRFYSRVLSSAELTAIEAGQDPYGAETSTAIVLSEPQAYQVHQHTDGSATLRISGCLTGAAQTLTDLQYNWNGAGWTDLSATVDDTKRTFTGTATISETSATPAGRQGTLQLRLKNNTAVTKSVQYIGIGDVFAIWGQSNSAGAYTNPQPYSPTNGLEGAFFGFDYQIRQLAENTTQKNIHASGARRWIDGSSENYQNGSIWPRVGALWTDRAGYPVMFVPAAVAASSIHANTSNVSGWDPTGAVVRNRMFNAYTVMKRRIQYLPGGARAAIGMQGENDAALGTTAADYQTYIETLANALFTDCGIKLANSILQDVASASTAAENEIRNGLAAAAAANANVLVGPDLSDLTVDDGNAHFTTDAKAVTIAGRWDTKMNTLFSFAPTDVSGLTLWLSDDTFWQLPDGTTVAGNGDQVGNWPAKSPTAISLSNSKLSRGILRTGVLNGHSVVEFNGTNTTLDATGLTAFRGNWYAMIVADVTNFQSALQVLFSLGTASDSVYAYLFPREDAAGGRTRFGVGASLVTVAGDPGTGYHIYECGFDGANIRLRVDGGTWATAAGAAQSTTDRVGLGFLTRPSYNFYCASKIAPPLIYDSWPSDSDLANLLSYARNRFGL